MPAFVRGSRSSFGDALGWAPEWGLHQGPEPRGGESLLPVVGAVRENVTPLPVSSPLSCAPLLLPLPMSPPSPFYSTNKK